MKRALVTLVVVWVALGLGLLAAIFAYGQTEQAQPADVIVVLGAGLQRNNRPGPALYRRTEQGAALWHNGIAENIICTGGFGFNRTRSEADACLELLRDQGVPAEVVLLEERSRSTEENAIYTREVMEANGWETAVVVSDGYHLLRAHVIFNRSGILHTTSPAHAPPPGNLLSSTLREVAAFHWLAFKWLLNLPVTHVPLI